MQNKNTPTQFLSTWNTHLLNGDHQSLDAAHYWLGYSTYQQKHAIYVKISLGYNRHQELIKCCKILVYQLHLHTDYRHGIILTGI